MKIDKNTLYADFVIYEDVLTDESQKALQQAVKEAYIDYYDLTIKDLFDCLRGRFDVIGLQAGKEQEATALQGLWVKGFSKWCEAFIKLIEGYALPQTIEAQQAAAKCLKMKFEESVLIFLREYFGLQSFKACYTLQVTDYIIAKRDAYNKAVFERQIAILTNQKMNKK